MRTRPVPGYTLLELLMLLLAAGLLAALAVPPILEWTARARLRLAASEVATVLRLARSHAVRHGANVGLKFETGDEHVAFNLYRDADGDGVRTADIRDGTDPPLGVERRLAHLGAHVRFGFPPGPAPTDPSDPGRLLQRLDDPIRFNNSNIASFSPVGESTPGSVYLTDSQRHLAAVRLFGRTGKVKVLLWDPDSRAWALD